MKLLGRRIFFSSPNRCDVLIFDECNSQYVRQTINENYHAGIFNMRPGDIFLGRNIIIQFLKELRAFSLKENQVNHRGLLYGLIKQFYCRYLKSCLEIIKPKAVITFIDNSNVFSWLARNCGNFPFIAIQNGSRLSYVADLHADYYVPHYFCFGRHEKALFPKLSYKVEHYYPVGSLVASLHFLPEQQVEEKYDLLIVSTWRGDVGFVQDVQDTMRSMRVMDQLLVEYIKEKKIKAAVIYRTERDSEHWIIPELKLSEEAYFREIYGNVVKHIETDASIRNIFPLMQQSHLIVSCLSTAAIEAYGLGKKILYCNFTGMDVYHQDIDDAILTTNNHYFEFSKQLDSLYDTSQEDYINSNQQLMKFYMNYPNDGVNTCEEISQGIDRIIAEF